MSIELESLKAGSIVKTYDNELYVKSKSGSWKHLAEAASAGVNHADLYTGELVYEVRKGPLDDFVVGDVISFDSMYGVRVATKLQSDFWQITGSIVDWTTHELNAIILEDSVRKMGSLDGRS